MTRTQKIRVRIAALALGVGVLLVPVTLSSGSQSALEVNEVCAEGVCCKELGSACDKDGEVTLNYYNDLSCEWQS